jgi:hypothetical protein
VKIWPTQLASVLLFLDAAVKYSVFDLSIEQVEGGGKLVDVDLELLEIVFGDSVYAFSVLGWGPLSLPWVDGRERGRWSEEVYDGLYSCGCGV